MESPGTANSSSPLASAFCRMLALACAFAAQSAALLCAQALPPERIPGRIVVEPRAIADPGFFYTAQDCPPVGTGYPVFECTLGFIGQGSGRCLVNACVSYSPSLNAAHSAFVPCSQSGGTKIRVSIRDEASGAWTSRFLRPFNTLGMIDPSIATSTRGAELLLVIGAGTAVYSLKYDALAGDFVSLPTTAANNWDRVAPSVPMQIVDKPFVIAGKWTEGLGQEYYVLFRRLGAPYEYRRSVDGGRRWSGGPVWVRTPTGIEFINGPFCPQPAVSGAGELYVVRPTDGSTYQFLHGHDVADDSCSGDCVRFEYLTTSSGSKLQVGLNPNLTDYIPAPSASIGPSCESGNGLIATLVPYLIADPTNSNRLYMLYEDLTGTTDMNVWCLRLERDPANGAWSKHGPFRVNDDNTPDAAGNIPDSLCISPAIDRFGRIHATFYDNRARCETANVCRKYDVYYAISEDGGETFTNVNLRSCDQRPALDFDALLLPPATSWSPHEYNGIALDDSSPAETIVWMTYGGAEQNDATIHRSLIWASRLRVRNPE